VQWAKGEIEGISDICPTEGTVGLSENRGYLCYIAKECGKFLKLRFYFNKYKRYRMNVGRGMNNWDVETGHK
jgi:hypothetical protein